MKMAMNSHRSEQTTPKPSSPFSLIKKIVDKIDLREAEENQILYRVRWPNSWEPEENLEGLTLLDAFKKGILVEDDDSADEHPLSLGSEYNPDEMRWEVQNILDRRIVRKQVQFFVQWKDTWVWGNDLKHRPKLIRDFNEAERQRIEIERLDMANQLIIQEADNRLYDDDDIEQHNETVSETSEHLDESETSSRGNRNESHEDDEPPSEAESSEEDEHVSETELDETETSFMGNQHASNRAYSPDSIEL